jgi:hypothetical protein
MNQVGSEVARADDIIIGGMGALAQAHEEVKWRADYDVRCYDADGNQLWREQFHNLITTAGKNLILDSALKTGVTSPAFYIGLKNTGTALAADTMASHSSWTENQHYSQSTRVAWTPGSIVSGSVDNSGSVATFTVSGSSNPDTYYGAFMVNQSTKGGSTGTLLSVGDFSVAQPGIDGNTITVQITISLA